MYLEHFGLRLLPFEDRADPQFHFATPEAAETIAALEYAVRYGHRPAIVAGEAGIGKTMLVRSLLQRLHNTDHAVVITVPTGDGRHIIREVAKAFGLTFSGHPTTRRCLARLRRYFTQHAREDHHAAVVFDQAEHLNAEEMLKAVALSELQIDDRRLASVILVGQPQMLTTLTAPEFARFRQQAFTESTLTGLSASQTGEYISTRLRVAGAANPDLFTPDAVLRICQHTGGNPRLINQLANACLVAAYGAGAETVDDDIAREAATRIKPAGAPRRPHEPHVILQRDKVARTITAARMDEPPIGSAADTRPAPAAGASSDFEDAADHERGEGIESTASSRGRRPVGAGGRRVSDAAARLTAMAGTTDAAVAADRLEALLRRADRARAMQDANLGHYGALEEHLEGLTRNAERLLDVLPAAVERASDVLADLTTRSESVLERFERRLDSIERRAESLSAASGEAEQKEAQLEESCARAARIETRMTGFAEELLEKLERSQEKVALLMTALESGDRAHADLKTLSREVAAVVETSRAEMDRREQALRDVIGRAEAVRESCTPEKMAAVESRFRAMIAELDRDQARVTDGLTEARTRVDEVLAAVEAAGEGAARHRDQFTQQLADMDKQAARFIQNARREQEEVRAVFEQVSRISNEAAGRTHEAEEAAHTLDGLLRDTAAAVDDVRRASGQMEVMQRTSSTMLVDIGAACERAAGTHRQIEGAQRLLEDITAARQGAAETSESLRAILREASLVKDAATAALGDLQQKSAQIGSHQAAASSLLGQLVEANRSGQAVLRGLDGASERAAETSQHVDERITAWQTAVAESDLVSGRIEDAVQNGKVLADDVRRLIDRLDGAHGATANELQQVGAACEQLRTLQTEAGQRAEALAALVQRAGEAAAVQETLNGSVSRAAQTTTRIQAVLEDAERRLAALMESGTGAEELVGRLTGARSRAIQAVERLDAAMSDSDGTIERIQQSAQAASAVTEQAERLVGAINALRGDVDDRVDAIERCTTEAATAQEQLQHLTTDMWSMRTDMDERMQRMAAEQSRAENLLSRITASADALGSVSAEIGTLVTTAEERARAVRTAMEGADEMTARLAHFAAVAESAEAGESKLAATVQAADELGRRLEAALAEVRADSGPVADAARLVQQADGLARSVGGLVEDGRRVADVLRAERDTAETVLRTLEDIGRQAERIAAEVQERTTELNDQVDRGEGVMRRIDEQADTVVAGERLMRELVAQAEQLSAQIRGLDSRAAKLDDKIEQAVARPMAAVEAAQTQAAKLESVCAAVRKVFAQLSKSALEANASSATFDRTSREATEKLTQLQQETHRAADTLQEWVAEAARAQERLARTLAQAPTISQTHPAGGLQALSRASEPLGAIVSKPAERIGRPSRQAPEPQEADEPMADAQLTTADAAVGRPRSRAEEIARLIADARKAKAK